VERPELRPAFHHRPFGRPSRLAGAVLVNQAVGVQVLQPADAVEHGLDHLDRRD
jgi:hypothetical protein